MNLYNKLLEIQKTVNGICKDKKSDYYEYVSGNKALGIIRPKMNELGLLLIPSITSIENIRQDYQTRNGAKSEILSKVMMTFTWIDTDSGETLEVLWGANGQNDWEKGLGSALTYGERYFLLKFFHIPTDEDDIDNPDRKADANIGVSSEIAKDLPPVQTKQTKSITQQHLDDPVSCESLCCWLYQAECTHSGKDFDYIAYVKKFYEIGLQVEIEFKTKYEEYRVAKRTKIK